MKFPAKDTPLTPGACKITGPVADSLITLPSLSFSTPAQPVNAPPSPGAPMNSTAPLPPNSSTTLPLVNPVEPQRMLTRSQTGHTKPKAFLDFKLYHSIKYPLTVL